MRIAASPRARYNHTMGYTFCLSARSILDQGVPQPLVLSGQLLRLSLFLAYGVAELKMADSYPMSETHRYLGRVDEKCKLELFSLNSDDSEFCIAPQFWPHSLKLSGFTSQWTECELIRYLQTFGQVKELHKMFDTSPNQVEPTYFVVFKVIISQQLCFNASISNPHRPFVAEQFQFDTLQDPEAASDLDTSRDDFRGRFQQYPKSDDLLGHGTEVHLSQDEICYYYYCYNSKWVSNVFRNYSEDWRQALAIQLNSSQLKETQTKLKLEKNDGNSSSNAKQQRSASYNSKTGKPEPQSKAELLLLDRSPSFAQSKHLASRSCLRAQESLERSFASRSEDNDSSSEGELESQLSVLENSSLDESEAHVSNIPTLHLENYSFPLPAVDNAIEGSPTGIVHSQETINQRPVFYRKPKISFFAFPGEPLTMSTSKS